MSRHKKQEVKGVGWTLNKEEVRNFCPSSNNCFDDEIKEDEMDVACSTHGGKRKTNTKW
jgi:hypothetical protein